MGLAETVRGAVATAKSVTAGLQVTVMHKHWDGTFNDVGQPNLGAPVARKALVEKKQRLVRAKDGTEQVSSTYIAFIEPLALTRFDEFLEPGETAYKPALNFTGLDSPIEAAGTTFTGEVYLG